MTDDTTAPPAELPTNSDSANNSDAPAAGSGAQQSRAAAILAAARAPKPDAGAAPASAEAPRRGPGRPRKVEGTPAAPGAPGEKKKRASGRKATRAELAARVRELTAAQNSAPGAAQPTAQPAAPEPSALHKPEVKARFAAGVSKAAQTGGRMMARRRGSHWAVTSMEGDALGEATADAVLCIEELAPSLAPYLGKAVQLSPLMIFAGVLFGVVNERLDMDAEIAAGRAQRVMPATGAVVTLAS